MNNDSTDIQGLSPRKLLENFTASRFVLWTVAAVAIHVVVIGGLSAGYIRDTWIDPEGAALRKAAAEAAAKAEAEKSVKPAPTAPATNVAPVTVPPPPTAAVASPTNAEASLIEKRKDTPVVKAITAVAPTNEIPKQPDDIGISIEDTKIR